MFKLTGFVFAVLFLFPSIVIAANCIDIAGTYTAGRIDKLEYRRHTVEQTGCETVTISNGKETFKISKEMTHFEKGKILNTLNTLNSKFFWKNVRYRMVRFEGSTLVIRAYGSLNTKAGAMKITVPLTADIIIRPPTESDLPSVYRTIDYTVYKPLVLKITKIQVAQPDSTVEWQYTAAGANLILDFLHPLVAYFTDSVAAKADF